MNDFVKGGCIGLGIVVLGMLAAFWFGSVLDWAMDLHKEYRLWVSEVMR